MDKNISVKSEPNIISLLPVKKVYCKNCKWFGGIKGSFFFEDEDWCDKVIDIIKVPAFDTPEQLFPEKNVEFYVKDYTKQNKNNDCKYYKRKCWKLWV